MASYIPNMADSIDDSSDEEHNGDGTDVVMNPTDPGAQLVQGEQTVNIQNILPGQAASAVPELEQLLGSLSLVGVPQGANPGNIVNIIRKLRLTVGNTENAVISSVPSHVKDKIQAAQKIFVKTLGYDDVCDSLDHHGHVLICGSPGCGKTTMSLFIAGEYLKKQYNVIFLEDVSKFKPEKHVSQIVPTLIVFDDVFGYFSLTTKQLIYCKTVFNCLKTRFKRLEEKRKQRQVKDNGDDVEKNNNEIPFKVIMNSRTNVLEMVRTKLLEYKNSLLRESTIADLTIRTKLRDDEKEKILRKHLKKCNKSLSDEDIKTIAQLEYSCLGFPHLCELFVDSCVPHQSVIRFFKEPMTYLVHQIADIFWTAESKDRAAVLLLMLLNDGVLSLVDLQSPEQFGLAEKMKKCKEVVEDLPSSGDIYLAARNENHTFLLSQGDIMRFSHPTIHDAVAFVVGDKTPLFVLENCTLQFLVERTKVMEDHKNGSPSSGDFATFMINLTSVMAEHLVKRLAKEILACDFALPLSHQCFSIESLVHCLFTELASSERMKTCLHSPDTKYGLGFLFWSSFICLGPLCKVAFEHTSFSVHAILEGCLGCCMSGNVSTLRTLVASSDENSDEIVKEITVATVGNILYQDQTRSLYRSLSSAGSPGKAELVCEKETPRMHGDNSDMLIHIAAANGFADIVEFLIELGTEVDARGGNQMTALMYGCYLGHVELVRMLLKYEADPFLLDEEGDNCLHLACRGGSTDIIHVLHQRKMNLNIRGEHDRTPLMYASYNGHEGIVRFLLENGAVAEPDLTFVKNKDNSLHLACVKGHTSVVRLLIEQGNMNIEGTGEKRRTPIMFACRNGNLETAKELMSRGAEVRIADNEGFTCLHLAAMKGHVPTAQWLLDVRATDSVDCMNARGRTPLMSAFQSGQTDMVKFLLMNGADLELRDNDHTSCLHFAVRSGSLALVEFCLEEGLDLNSVTATGLTPAMTACSKGNMDLLRYLVGKGADINRGCSGSCLHSAALSGSLDVVEYVLSLCTELNAVNKQGFQNKTPIMLACLHGNKDVAEHLMKCGADVELRDEFQKTCLHMACQGGYHDMVEWLLGLDSFDINAVDTNGWTPLFFAVKSDNPDVITLLVNQGADMNVVDGDGRTCLHIATWHGKIKSCRRLIDLGMNPDVHDNQNKTPLMSAVSSRYYQSEISELLLENGANLNQRDSNGDTCLHTAAFSGHPAHIDFLLEHGLDINIKGASLQTPIMSACRGGNTFAFDVLLQRGADVNLLNSMGRSCLHLACMSKTTDLHILRKLVTLGLDVNAHSNKNQTPAMCAVSTMNVHALKLMLSCGASHNTLDQRGIKGSLLHFACNNEKMITDIPQVLIEQGISVDARDRYHQTPAMCAARKGNREVLDFLIASGASLRVVDRYGRNCLSHAEDGGHQVLVDYLYGMTY